MKKIILVGRSETGKTTLTQALKGENKEMYEHKLEEWDMLCNKKA